MPSFAPKTQRDQNACRISRHLNRKRQFLNEVLFLDKTGLTTKCIIVFFPSLVSLYQDINQKNGLIQKQKALNKIRLSSQFSFCCQFKKQIPFTEKVRFYDHKKILKRSQSIVIKALRMSIIVCKLQQIVQNSPKKKYFLTKFSMHFFTVKSRLSVMILSYDIIIKKMRAQKLSPATKLSESVSIWSDFELDPISSLSMEKQDFDDDFQNMTVHRNKSQPSSKQANSKSKWTFQDEEKLIQLHKMFGNKWTNLSKSFPSMSQNSIKNRFYSRLRKSIRKLNKTIEVLKLREYNKFKLNIIFQLSNISETKLLEKDRVSPQIFQFYKEFLYDLIEFSNQMHYITGQGHNHYQTKQQIQQLILPLIALENLFRLVRGERAAKGKKKNIAYLRQFTFKLSLQSPIFMIITKENTYLQTTQQITQAQIPEHFQQQKTIIKKSSIMTQSSFESIEPFGKSLLSSPSHGKQLQIDEQIQFFIPSTTENPHIEQDPKDAKVQSQMWKDYLGCEMKEIDLYGAESQDHDHLNQFQMVSMRDIDLSDESVCF